ncbi:SDR family oxidoreductase [Actinocatenispora sera]|jgi:NAD(P)-dependent dehydrogenase (short-subunit alcohol dehydrogenase family)|uniref:Short-chain dehydrogenase n=1 Tax=Actinocatenispora sera TaxID=390989 RepID=A0A810L3L8_9ACTN|nr:SDR family oxidoreductase [Actinocatenispora sera]BCJ29973.1 short-chain dehydrogenase [Actinocatenispora sera]
MTSQNEFLAGTTVLVAGGSSGIGLATARAARAAGAEVTVTGRNESRLRAAGDGIAWRIADLHDHDTIAAAMPERLDHLVLAAGDAAGIGPVAGLDLASVRSGLDTKVIGFLGAIQAALPALRPGGSITLVGAASARNAAPGAVGLAMINGAVEAGVASLAAELAPVRVNAVSPGVVDTAWWSGFPAEAREAVFTQYGKAATMGRIATADDVARAILALMTNAYLTGTVLPVDGGPAAA